MCLSFKNRVGLIYVLILFVTLSIFINLGTAKEAGRKQADLSKLNRSQILQSMGQRTAQDFIRPNYEALLKSSKDMEQSITALCGASGPDQLNQAHTSFYSLIKAWSTASIIHFGAIAIDYRLERFSYWPDRKGRGMRTVRKILAKQDKSVLSKETLAKKSIAVQGLPALELILFETLKKNIKDQFACSYALSITQNLKAISKELVAAWQDDGASYRAFTTPGKENPAYQTNKEIVVEIYKAITSNLDGFSKIKLAPFLKEGQENRRARHLPYWRSQYSIEALKSEFLAMVKLLKISGFYNLIINGSKDQEAFYREVFDRLTTDLTLPKVANEELLSKAETKAKLLEALTELIKLSPLLNRKMAINADLPLGFNASDGD